MKFDDAMTRLYNKKPTVQDMTYLYDILHKTYYENYGKEGVDYKWPMNLLKIIKPNDEYIYRTEDELLRLNENLSYVLKETMTDREREVIYFRFYSGMTLDALAKRYNLTKERIRQIVQKAIRKLHHPTRIKLIFEGKDIYDEMEKMRHDLNLAKVNLASDLSNLNIKRAKIREITEIQDAIDGLKINEMDLSVRTYNCLMRAGIRCAHDLEMMTTDEVIKIRNLGRRSFNELTAYMHGLGIFFIDEKVEMQETKEPDKKV